MCAPRPCGKLVRAGGHEWNARCTASALRLRFGGGRHGRHQESGRVRVAPRVRHSPMSRLRWRRSVPGEQRRLVRVLRGGAFGLRRDSGCLAASGAVLGRRAHTRHGVTGRRTGESLDCITALQSAAPALRPDHSFIFCVRVIFCLASWHRRTASAQQASAAARVALVPCKQSGRCHRARRSCVRRSRRSRSSPHWWGDRVAPVSSGLATTA